MSIAYFIVIFGAKFVNLINKKPVELLAKVENVTSSESKRDEYTILPLVLYLEWVNHFEDFVGLVVYVPFFFLKIIAISGITIRSQFTYLLGIPSILIHLL